MEKRATFRSTGTGLLFALPVLLLIFVFFYWPSAQALYWSLTLEQPWGGGHTWVGLQNFSQLLHDRVYWNSILRSLVFALVSTGTSVIVAATCALFIDRELSGSRIYRSVLIWPYAMVAPAVGLAFRFIMAPESGLLAYLNHIWPGVWNPALDGRDAMIAVIAAFAWKYVGYNLIFFVAALQSLPRSLTEAAALDGAGPLRRIIDFQLPLLTPTLFFLLVINITEGFQDSFAIVDILTQGGPARATELMVYKIYFDGFKGLDYSGAAAQSIILMGLLILLTIVQFRFLERRVHYR